MLGIEKYKGHNIYKVTESIVRIIPHQQSKIDYAGVGIFEKQHQADKITSSVQNIRAVLSSQFLVFGS